MPSKRMTVRVEVVTPPDAWQSGERMLLRYSRDTFNVPNLGDVLKEILPGVASTVANAVRIVYSCKAVH